VKFDSLFNASSASPLSFQIRHVHLLCSSHRRDHLIDAVPPLLQNPSKPVLAICSRPDSAARSCSAAAPRRSPPPL
jgi:hypothetical protein